MPEVKIENADCRTLMASLPDRHVHAIVTDPPYGISVAGADWDRTLPDRDIWDQCLRVLKPGGFAALCGHSTTFHRLACLLEAVGFEVRDFLFWVGTANAATTSIRLRNTYEPVILVRRPTEGLSAAAAQQVHGTGLRPRSEEVAIRNGFRPLVERLDHRVTAQVYGNQRVKAEIGITNSGRQAANMALDEAYAAEIERTVGAGSTRTLFVGKATPAERAQAGGHPTVKPLSLMRHIIGLMTPPGGLVLDPFCGSGSTAVACVQMGRDFIGCDRDPGYAEAARRRVADEIEKPTFTPSDLTTVTHLYARQQTLDL